jgi:regulator of protease activity HflC (stomatin/prohibitin superfamily)
VFVTFVIGILVIATVAAFLFHRGVAAALLVVTVVATGFATVTVVGATDVGVPVAFGNVQTPIKSGLHVVAPWTGVETYPIRPFSADDQVVQARTLQAGSVQYKVGARWHVNPDQARETYMQIRSGDEESINQKIVDPNLSTAAGNVAVTRDNLAATTDRIGIETDLKGELQRLVNGYGIVIDTVTIRHIEPDAGTSDAIARLSSQQQATKVAVEAVNTAEQQAKAAHQQALGAKQAALDVAKVTDTQAYVLCVQAWERMATKAIDQHQSVLTQPCGGSAPALVAQH